MTECLGPELFLTESYELPEINDFFDNLGSIQNLLPGEDTTEGFLPDVEPLSEIVTQLSQPPSEHQVIPTNSSVPAPTSPVHPLLHKNIHFPTFPAPFTFTACDIEAKINPRKRPLSNQLTLTRDELLKISSEKYDQIVQSVMSQRPLTIEEERLVKRQKRLIKNRESAQVSRDRKKGYITELEVKVASLVAENESLAQENKSLKEENTELRNIIRTQLPNKIPEIKAEKGSFNDKKGLAVLAIFFFAFVFGFGPSVFQGFSENRIEPISAFPGGRVLNTIEILDNLQQTTQDSPPTKAEIVNNVSVRSETPADLNLLQKHLHRVHTNSKPSEKVQPALQNKQREEGNENRRNKVVIHSDDDDIEPSVTKNLPSTARGSESTNSQSSNGLVPVKPAYAPQISPLDKARFTTVGGTWTKPNLYMHCRQYEVLSIPDLNLTSELEGPPQVFSLLLPASFLSNNSSYQNYFVEVNSQILGIFPLYLSNSTLASPLPK